MSDLIKREDAIKVVDSYTLGQTPIVEKLKDIPSVEPTIEIDADQLAKLLREGWTLSEEPKRGEWKITNTYKDHYGRVVDRVEHTDCGYIWHREMGKPLYNFCPNCGADMRKGADDE